MHLGPGPYPNGPPADTGWPSGYNVFASWSSPTAPNAPLESAQVAFDRVFAAVGESKTDPLVEKRRRLKTSVLDYVIDQVGAISPRLGKDDGRKLDEYLTSIHDVETRLKESAAMTATSCATGTPPEANLDHPTHTKAMLDILVLALQCDATRFVTYSMDYGFGNKDLNFLGHAKRHHNLSHSGTAPETIAAHKAAVKWYVDQFAYLLTRLDGIDEVGSTVLDNSVVFLGSDVGEAWTHDHMDLTAILAGKGAGALHPGRLIDPMGKTYASFLLGLIRAMDADVASFAGSTTPFAGL